MKASDRPATAPTKPVPNYARALDRIRQATSDAERAAHSRRLGNHGGAEGFDDLAREGLRAALAELDAGQHPAVQADRALNLGLPL